MVLGRGDGVNMSDEKRNQIYGQARFFRAYTMFVLLRLYGGLAIPESYTVRLDGLEIPRKTVDETYDFIIQDLEYCIANLPTRSQWGSGSYYKASKGAAQALLGDVYLTRGCMDNNNTVYFQEAKKQLGDVINSVNMNYYLIINLCGIGLWRRLLKIRKSLCWRSNSDLLK